jgi:alcohol dehydrogenase
VEALVVRPGDPPQVAFEAEYPTPQAPPGEVLIRVHVTGICATDLEIVCGYMRFAGVLGHEFVGTVVDGPAELRGERVVGEINCPCRQCATCQRGQFHHCPHRSVLGIVSRDGAFAEFLTLPAANCHRVPPGITDEQAVFVEPLAAAAHVLDAVPVSSDTRATVIGSGRLGLLVAQVLAHRTRHLVVLGRNPATLRLCQSWGIAAQHSDETTPAADQDIVVECTGRPAGLRRAMELCRPTGTIVLKSTYAEPAGIDLAPIVIHEQRVIGSRCGDFSAALRLLSDGAVRVDELVSRRFPLSEGVAALTAAAQPTNVKVLLCPRAA